jgi:hypothetical protein
MCIGSIFDDDNYVGCNNVGHQLVFILGYKHNGDLGGSWCSCVLDLDRIASEV